MWKNAVLSLWLALTLCSTASVSVAQTSSPELPLNLHQPEFRLNIYEPAFLKFVRMHYVPILFENAQAEFEESVKSALRTSGAREIRDEYELSFSSLSASSLNSLVEKITELTDSRFEVLQLKIFEFPDQALPLAELKIAQGQKLAKHRELIAELQVLEDKLALLKHQRASIFKTREAQSLVAEKKTEIHAKVREILGLGVEVSFRSIDPELSDDSVARLVDETLEHLDQWLGAKLTVSFDIAMKDNLTSLSGSLKNPHENTDRQYELYWQSKEKEVEKFYNTYGVPSEDEISSWTEEKRQRFLRERAYIEELEPRIPRVVGGVREFRPEFEAEYLADNRVASVEAEAIAQPIIRLRGLDAFLEFPDSSIPGVSFDLEELKDTEWKLTDDVQVGIDMDIQLDIADSFKPVRLVPVRVENNLGSIQIANDDVLGFENLVTREDQLRAVVNQIFTPEQNGIGDRGLTVLKTFLNESYLKKSLDFVFIVERLDDGTYKTQLKLDSEELQLEIAMMKQEFAFSPDSQLVGVFSTSVPFSLLGEIPKPQRNAKTGEWEVDISLPRELSSTWKLDFLQITPEVLGSPDHRLVKKLVNTLALTEETRFGSGLAREGMEFKGSIEIPEGESNSLVIRIPEEISSDQIYELRLEDLSVQAEGIRNAQFSELEAFLLPDSNPISVDPQNPVSTADQIYEQFPTFIQNVYEILPDGAELTIERDIKEFLEDEIGSFIVRRSDYDERRDPHVEVYNVRLDEHGEPVWEPFKFVPVRDENGELVYDGFDMDFSDFDLNELEGSGMESIDPTLFQEDAVRWVPENIEPKVRFKLRFGLHQNLGVRVQDYEDRGHRLVPDLKFVLQSASKAPEFEMLMGVYQHPNGRLVVLPTHWNLFSVLADRQRATGALGIKTTGVQNSELDQAAMVGGIAGTLMGASDWLAVKVLGHKVRTTSENLNATVGSFIENQLLIRTLDDALAEDTSEHASKFLSILSGQINGPGTELFYVDDSSAEDFIDSFRRQRDQRDLGEAIRNAESTLRAPPSREERNFQLWREERRGGARATEEERLTALLTQALGQDAVPAQPETREDFWNDRSFQAMAEAAYEDRLRNSVKPEHHRSVAGRLQDTFEGKIELLEGKFPFRESFGDLEFKHSVVPVPMLQVSSNLASKAEEEIREQLFLQLDQVNMNAAIGGLTGSVRQLALDQVAKLPQNFEGAFSGELIDGVSMPASLDGGFDLLQFINMTAVAQSVRLSQAIRSGFVLNQEELAGRMAEGFEGEASDEGLSQFLPEACEIPDHLRAVVRPEDEELPDDVLNIIEFAGSTKPAEETAPAAPSSLPLDFDHSFLHFSVSEELIEEYLEKRIEAMEVLLTEKLRAARDDDFKAKLVLERDAEIRLKPLPGRRFFEINADGSADVRVQVEVWQDGSLLWFVPDSLDGLDPRTSFELGGRLEAGMITQKLERPETASDEQLGHYLTFSLISDGDVNNGFNFIKDPQKPRKWAANKLLIQLEEMLRYQPLPSQFIKSNIDFPGNGGSGNPLVGFQRMTVFGESQQGEGFVSVGVRPVLNAEEPSRQFFMDLRDLSPKAEDEDF